MASESGTALLQSVAERIVARFLEHTGHTDVTFMNRRLAGPSETGVDLAYSYAGRGFKIKVKPDPYYGTDPSKVNDRSLLFYRSDAEHYAFESISNHMTREPGWMFNSDADDLYYYYLAIAQAEEEIRALLGEPDDVFFEELQVERDQLRILPMRPTQEWFQAHYERYTPRPVVLGDHSAWYRLIPRMDIDSAVDGIRSVGSIFPVANT